MNGYWPDDVNKIAIFVASIDAAATHWTFYATMPFWMVVVTGTTSMSNDTTERRDTTITRTAVTTPTRRRRRFPFTFVFLFAVCVCAMNVFGVCVCERWDGRFCLSAATVCEIACVCVCVVGRTYIVYECTYGNRRENHTVCYILYIL